MIDVNSGGRGAEVRKGSEEGFTPGFLYVYTLGDSCFSGWMYLRVVDLCILSPRF